MEEVVDQAIWFAKDRRTTEKTARSNSFVICGVVCRGSVEVAFVMDVPPGRQSVLHGVGY